LLTVVAALLVQTLTGGSSGEPRNRFDLFLITATAWGLAGGRTAGLVAGTMAGLVQDAYSAGILGLNGFSKSTVGYLAGLLGGRLILRGFGPRMLFFLAASIADMGIVLVICWAAERPVAWKTPLGVFSVAVVNGILGGAVMGLVEWQRRRLSR
jgi:rod shape-determining protein MreD